jgi:hypothetical protein
VAKMLHGENAEFMNITAGGKYTYHYALKCKLLKCRPTSVQLISRLKQNKRKRNKGNVNKLMCTGLLANELLNGHK